MFFLAHSYMLSFPFSSLPHTRALATACLMEGSSSTSHQLLQTPPIPIGKPSLEQQLHPGPKISQKAPKIPLLILLI